MNKIRILSDTSNIENQDRAEVVQRSNDDILIIVADGAGGMGDGSKAAEKVIRLAKNYVISEQKFTEPDTWVRLLYEIDTDLLHDKNTGEATCVVAAVRKGFVSGASVGDSGAWCIDNSNIADFTENQKRKPLLGSGEAIPIPFGPFQCKGTLIVATDGFLKYIENKELIRIMKCDDSEETVKQMIEAVRLPSGTFWDDTTIVLLRQY